MEGPIKVVGELVTFETGKINQDPPVANTAEDGSRPSSAAGGGSVQSGRIGKTVPDGEKIVMPAPPLCESSDSDDDSDSDPTPSSSRPQTSTQAGGSKQLYDPNDITCSDLYENFDTRQKEMLAMLSGLKRDHKRNIIVDAYSHNHIQKRNIGELLKSIGNLDGESDFEVIIIIRFLYIMKRKYPHLSAEEKAEFDTCLLDILPVLRKYVFWPRKKDKIPGRDRADKIVFWSENHIFMMLGSCHLFQQFINDSGTWLGHLKEPSSSAVCSSDTPKSHDVGGGVVGGISVAARSSSDVPQGARGHHADSGEKLEKYDSDLSSVHILKPSSVSSSSNVKVEDTCSKYDQTNSINLETKLLKVYLRAHVNVQGEYECCSHVYIPYSICALLNLYDFSEDESIKNDALTILELMASHILACTSDTGIANLSASARAFLRTRLKTSGHNINHLIRLLCNVSVDPWKPTVITGFISTTSWRPSPFVYQYYRHYGEMMSFPLTHKVEETKSVFDKANTELYRESQFINLERGKSRSEIYGSDSSKEKFVDKDEMVPFYWSCGLLLHRDFIEDTNTYIKSRALQHNVHLKLFSWLPDSMAELLTHKLDHFSSGQAYAGATLHSYKSRGGLVLSSFSGLGGGIASYQQLHWVANISGIGVWTQSGNGTEGREGTAITNTHSPYLKQLNNVIVLGYSVPRSAIVGNIIGSKVRLFWPNTEFDEMVGVPESMERKAEIEVQRSADSGENSPTEKKPKKMKKQKKESLISSLLSSVGLGGDSSPRKSTIREGTWWCARHLSSYVGVNCTADSFIENTPTKDSIHEYSSGTGIMSRRICRESDHGWLIVTGTIEDYLSLRDFQEYCKKFRMSTKYNEKSIYEVTAHIPQREQPVVVRCSNK